MDATTALLVQGCACAPTAHPAVTAAMASERNPEVGAPIACDAGPYVEFDTMLEQMAEQLQTTEPRHGAEPTVAAESAKRNGHGARAIRADAEVDTQPAGDDDDDGDGDEDADGPGSAALRQMTMMPAGPAVTAPIQTHTMRRSTRRVEGAWSGRMAGEVPALPNGLAAAGTEELMTAEPEQFAGERSVDGQDCVSRQPEGAQTAMDQTKDSTIGQAGRAAGGSSADRAPVRESATVSTERSAGDTDRTAARVEPKNVHTSARVGRDEPARDGFPKPMGMPATEPGMAPRVQERTVAVMHERETAPPGRRTMVLPDMRGAVNPDGSARDRVSQQPSDRSSAAVDARVSQPEGDHVPVDQTNGSTAGQSSRAAGRTPADKAPVRESATVSTARPVDGGVRTAPQVGSRNVHISARVGRDEPARNGSLRPMGMPTTEPGTAPRVQERTVGVVQERETARPEGRTIVLPDMRGTADPDGRARVAPERLTMAATEEPMAIGSEQPAEARSTEGQGRVSQQLGDRTSASMDARAPQPEGAHVAMDQVNESTVGRGSRVTTGTLAERTPIRESGTASAERPVAGRVRTAPQVKPENVRASARVGRDEPALNGSPGPADVPVTEPDMAPRVQEPTAAAMQERSTARPERRTMVLPHVRGAADSDGSARVAPERLTMAATEEPIATEPEQPAEAGLTEVQITDGQGRVSQQPGDRTSASMDARAPQPEGAHVAMDQVNDSTVGQGGRASGGPPADQAPVRESATASTERPVSGRVRTTPQVKPENVRASARVGRDEPALNGSPGPADVPVTEPDMAPWVQEPTAAAIDSDGSARVAPERLTMPATEEPMATGSEQPAEAQSAEGQGRVSQQLGDRTSASMDARAPQPEGAHVAMDQVNESTVGRGSRVTTGTLAERTPIRESGTASAERPVAGRVRTAPQVESKNAHTTVRVGRDEPALNGSPGPADVPVTEPDMAPRVQEPTAAAMQERSTARPERRTMVLPHVRGAADSDGRARVAPERLTMAATEEPMATGSEQPTEAQSTEGQGRVSQQLGDRASGGTPADQVPIRESGTASTERPVAGRVRTAPQVEPKNAETAESWQTALQPTAPRREGAMTALVESLARHRNLPNPLWEEGLQKAGRREPETNDRPDLAVVVGPTHTMIPAEGPDVSQTPQAARPALTEPAGSSVTRQIAAHVSARAAQGGGEFRARLVPEHLGSVQIRVRVVRGVCTADIRADDAEVARYIESHSSDLKVSLAEHGIDLSGLSVSSRSRAQEGWGAATLSHSESDWSAPSWNGANARQQYAAAAFAGGSSGHGRGERRGMPAQSSPVVGTSHHAARQSGSPSPDEPIATRWVRGYARIDYLA